MKQKIKKIIFILFILIIIFVGIGLRTYNLDKRSIWYDEGISIIYSQGTLHNALNSANMDYLPPFYYIILHTWSLIFGSTLFLLRFLSAIFGILSLFLIFLLGKELFDKPTGIISAIILTFSITHIYYSREIRPYSLLLFLTLCSFYFFIKYIKNRNLLHLSFIILINSLLIYMHIFSWFIIIIQNMYFIYYNKKYNRREKNYIKKQKNLENIFLDNTIINWFIGNIIPFLIYVPYIPRLILIYSEINEKFWIKSVKIIGTDIFSISGTLIQFSNNLILLSLFIVLFIIAIIKFNLKKEKMSENTKLLLFWFFIPIIITFLYSKIATQSIFVTRYFIIIIPAYYFLISRTIIFCFKNNAIRITIVSLIIILSIFAIIHYDEKPITSEDYKTSSNYIKNQFNNQTDVVVAEAAETFMYYFDKTTIDNLSNFSEFYLNTLKQKNVIDLIHHLYNNSIWSIPDNKNTWVLLRYTSCKTAEYAFLEKRILKFEKEFDGIFVCYYSYKTE